MISSCFLYATDLYRDFLFGVDYYPEHWPDTHWEEDAKLMKSSGVNTVRIGEFAWYYFEPEEGVYQFDLFDRAIKVLSNYDIKIIIGTPTAAPPKWMTHQYPSILYVDKHGAASNDQARRHYNYNSPIYRKFCKKIVTELCKHYQDNSNVIGWQIDNEFNCIYDEFYSEADQVAFRKWLQNKYVHLDSLNIRWGTQFWSQWYTDWEQINLPFKATAQHNPSLILDFKRFISNSVVEFQRNQVDVIRELCPTTFITHNDYHAWNIDFYKLSKDLDIFAYDNYPCFHNPPRYKMGNFLTMARSFKNKFMVMEQQSGPGGSNTIQRTPDPGQMRLWAWQAIAHGADGIVHFRWRTARFGIEEYWHGIIDQDNIPRARYDEFKKEGFEIKKVADEILGSQIKSDIAVLRDFENEWALKYQHISNEMDVRGPYDYFYKAASQLGYNIDFVSSHQDFSKYKLLVMPFHVIIEKALAKRLKTYVANGGILITSAHTGLKNRDNILYEQKYPANLCDLFGIERDYFHRYASPSKEKNNLLFHSGESVPVYILAEVLKLEGAKPVATWEHDYLKGLPAVTEHKYGKGKAVYYASFFNYESAPVLLKKYTRELGLKPFFKNLPDCVEVTCREKDGDEYFFLLNHSKYPVTIDLEEKMFNMFTSKNLKGSVNLNGYDVLLLKK